MSQRPHQQLFRPEALDHHARPEAKGYLLRIQPLWARLTFWIILCMVITAGTGLALVDINDYATGPVLIQVRGLEDVTTISQGRVSRVFVNRGDHVQAGQPLAAQIRRPIVDVRIGTPLESVARVAPP